MLRYKGLRQFSWLVHKILIIPNESKQTVLIHSALEQSFSGGRP